MPSKFKPMSDAGKAHKRAIKELHQAQEMLNCAIARVHRTAAALAVHHNCDPEEFNILSGPGGGK